MSNYVGVTENKNFQCGGKEVQMKDQGGYEKI